MLILSHNYTIMVLLSYYHPSLMRSYCYYKNDLRLTERLWLPPGSLLGGRPDGRLLLHGPALVRRCHRHLYCSHRLPEDGERVERSRRAASVPRGQVGPQ